MTMILDNQTIKLAIYHPGEIYRGSRFDWSGQIAQITYQNKYTFCTTETEYQGLLANTGSGLYNEFGIDGALGHEDCPAEGQFHKMGVGLLTRSNMAAYQFMNTYAMQPAEIAVAFDHSSAIFRVSAPNLRGYAYQFIKTIELTHDGFRIHYHLTNTGDRLIDTNEYIHNFIAIQGHVLDKNYVLRFPFQLDAGLFQECVNPETAVIFGPNTLKWQFTPTVPFYFSHVNPSHQPAFWEIKHLTENISIRETVDFEIQRINIWGTRHVVSPEIFYHIHLLPGQSCQWVRTYEINLL